MIDRKKEWKWLPILVCSNRVEKIWIYSNLNEAIEFCVQKNVVNKIL